MIDPPFGKKVAVWDEKIFSRADWRSILQDVLHVADGRPFSLAIYCQPEMYNDISLEMQECGFLGIGPYYWVKTDTNQNGSPSLFLNAVQMLIIGHSNKDHMALQKGLPDNPSERLNVRYAFGVRDPAKHSESGQVINGTEKPGEIALYFCNMFLRGLRTQRALFLGAGAGGDVMGALQGGYHVIYIDKDPEQQSQLALRILTKKQLMEHQLHERELELAGAGLITREDYNRVSKLVLLPFCPRLEASAALSEQPPTVKQIRQANPPPAVSGKPGPSCVACGSSDALAKCTGCACPLCRCSGEDPASRVCDMCQHAKAAAAALAAPKEPAEEGEEV